MESHAISMRLLSPDQREAIRYFYKLQWGVGTFLSVFLPLVLCLSLGARSSFWGSLALGAFVAALLNALRYWNARRKMTRAAFIYEHGQPETVTFTGLGANYGVKVNGQPQPVINLLCGNEPLKIKTFDSRIIEAFSHPRQVVYMHPNYPNVLVPSGLFTLTRAAGAHPKTRTVGV